MWLQNISSLESTLCMDSVECAIVGQINANLHKNCAKCDTSNKFGKVVQKSVLNKTARVAIANFKMAAIFSRWPPRSMLNFVFFIEHRLYYRFQ